MAGTRPLPAQSSRRPFLAVCILLGLLACPLTAEASGPRTRAEALVLVNSTSPGYPDFERYIRPYLTHFGIAYTVVDLATEPLRGGIDDFALIIIAHRQIDSTHAYLDATEQATISSAVASGAGLLNFDNNLAPRYQFVQDVFGFGLGGATEGADVSFPNGSLHYIAARHSPGETIATAQMSLPGVTLPASVTPIAISNGQPFIAVTAYGAGRAVQWGSYDWILTRVHGPVYGFDDLVWRSIVWAARKPFVMQGMPPFLTMRVDDETGGFEWIHIANEFGIKPWAGLFIDSIDPAEGADLSALTHAGLATAGIHAFSDTNFFYYDHNGRRNFSDATVSANFGVGAKWYRDHNIAISQYLVPHYYELGSNVLQGLSDWSVEFVGTQQLPGQPYRSPWLMIGPFRRYEPGDSGARLPVHYADFLTIPLRPDYDRKFFNCVTEIRDDAGYEWYPDLTDVNGTVARGTRQLKRALDGMDLATLLTHGYFVSSRWGASAPGNWRAILRGITDNLRPYDPVGVTMDYACRYIRATTTSDIASATYDPASRQVTVTMTGTTDVPTQLFLFVTDDQKRMVELPPFRGEMTLSFGLPDPLDRVMYFPIVRR